MPTSRYNNLGFDTLVLTLGPYLRPVFEKDPWNRKECDCDEAEETGCPRDAKPIIH